MLSCLMAFVDIFVGNGTFVDREVYQLWLGGYSGTCDKILVVNVQIELMN